MHWLGSIDGKNSLVHRKTKKIAPDDRAMDGWEMVMRRHDVGESLAMQKSRSTNLLG
jgi:hypothetical protein